MQRRIHILDTTLRDGAQTKGVDFTLSDKIAIYESLQELGIDYIEAGWPGANATDTELFQALSVEQKRNAIAFGMTAQVGKSVENDPLLSALIDAKPYGITLVGKASSQQVKEALQADPHTYLEIIRGSIARVAEKVEEALFDAEHFFDGYKLDPDFAKSAISCALAGGAKWVVLCDTNGGSLPREVANIVEDICQTFPGAQVGIHSHNDIGLGVAVSQAAIEAGAGMVQGTLNGLGERCGNANLTTLLPNLALKCDYNIGLSGERLQKLKKVSVSFDERLYRQPNPYAPYVGKSAFAHKGGLHASAVEKNPSLYEHINPEIVGNIRDIVVSDQAGKASMRSRLARMNLPATFKVTKEVVDSVLDAVKVREAEGFSFDDSDASLDLFIREQIELSCYYFDLVRFRVIDDHRINAVGEAAVESEATIRLKVAGRDIHSVALGNGPVNALDNALRDGLSALYPVLHDLRLEDYKVRIIPPARNSVGTDAIVRVHLESNSVQIPKWCTLGMSHNIIDASFQALRDSYHYYLMMMGVTPLKISS